ncbi:hypothetical protein SDC9_193621 [bioreactor metagenome]|uniref:Uncharacterized protein n=1 Tax=bioreactor metagenome TaxID=1076179 RepID=A0A645I5J2_9ZZZZ
MSKHLIDGNGFCSEYQSNSDNNKTHCLVKNNRFQRGHFETPYQDRKTELRTTKANQAA